MQRRYRVVFAAAAAALSVLVAACSGHSGAGVLPSAGNAASNNASAIEAQALHQSGAHVTYASGGFSLSLKPNYQAGFGPYKYQRYFVNPPGCMLGCSHPTPEPGTTASLGGGNVDFGDVTASEDYLYGNAMQVSVVAPSAFLMYAEASGTFSGPTAIGTDALEWVPTSSLGHGGGGDYGAAAVMQGIPFQTASVFGAGQSYPIISAKLGSYTYKYDYILRVPDDASVGSYSAQVVYTVVP